MFSILKLLWYNAEDHMTFFFIDTIKRYGSLYFHYSLLIKNFAV